MFVVLSHVIEAVTGQWLGETLYDWLWKPLRMLGTLLSLEDILPT
jgi:CubicO group peptidase (beta-lactamase class C family)